MSVPVSRLVAAAHHSAAPSANPHEYGKALWDYTADHPEKFSFKAGDQFLILSKEGDWWRCKFRGKEGVVPSNYIEIIQKPSSSSRASVRPLPPSPAPQQTFEHVKALYDYNAQADHDLSFKAGDEMILLGKDVSGWWKCRLGDKEGDVPSNYVEIILPPKPAPVQHHKPVPQKKDPVKAHVKKESTSSTRSAAPAPSVDLFAKAAEEKYKKARELFNEGMMAFAQGNYDLTGKLFDQAIRLYPLDADFHEYRGYFHAKKGEAIYAIDDYECSILIDPSREHLRNEHQRLAIIYYGFWRSYHQSEVQKYISRYDQSTSPNGRSENGKIISSDAIKAAEEQLKAYDYSDLFKNLNLAVKYFPEVQSSGNFLLWKGVVLHKTHQHQESLVCLKEAVNVLISDLNKSEYKFGFLGELINAHYNLGLVFSHLNQSEQALAEFEKASVKAKEIEELHLKTFPLESKSDPKNWLKSFRSLQMRIAFEERKLGAKVLEARLFASEAIKALQQNQNPRALQLARQAISTYSFFPEGYLLLALALLRDDQLQEGIRTLQRSFDLGLTAHLLQDLMTSLREHEKKMEGPLSQHREWLRKAKTPIAEVAIKNAIQGCSQPPQGLPAYSPVAVNGKMDSGKQKELQKLVEEQLEKNRLLNEAFTDLHCPLAQYHLGKTLQTFFTADPKKKDRVHFSIKESNIKTDPLLNLHVEKSIQDCKSQIPQNGLPPLLLPYRCSQNVEIQQKIAAVLAQWDFIIQENATPFGQYIDISNITQATLPPKPYWTNETKLQDQPVREQACKPRAPVVTRTSAPAASSTPYVVPPPYKVTQPYGQPHEHPIFNQENLEKLQEGIMGIAEAYVDGMKQMQDIQQGNYP